MDEATFSHVLDGVYDATTAFDRWTAPMDRLGKAFHSAYTGLIDRNLRTMEGRAAAVGIDAAGYREYFDVWSNRDVLRQWTPAFRAGAIERDPEILPREELVRSDYFNGFMKPRDHSSFIRMTLVVGPVFRKIISMSRPASIGPFTNKEVEHCQRLMPHFQRVLRVSQEIEAARVELSAVSTVLERSATGVLLIDRTGEVAFANAAARAMAATGDAFVLGGDRIRAIESGADANLQRLIAGAAGRTDRVTDARGGVIRLPRKSGGAPFSLAAAPLGDMTWSETGAVAFVLINDPDAAAPQAVSAMRQLFGLSAAEARVARRLMMGDTPEQAAAALNIRTSTARWHLASLYRKTGTSRQAQLVRLLLSMPTI